MNQQIYKSIRPVTVAVYRDNHTTKNLSGNDKFLLFFYVHIHCDI